MKELKNYARKLLVLMAGIALVGFAVPAEAATSITQTKHNLGSGGPAGRDVSTSSTDEVCVFCHTPHGAAGIAPLWNRAVTGASYAMYTSSTIDSAISSQPTGVSLACLSCHDGTVALDALRNTSGSGTSWTSFVPWFGTGGGSSGAQPGTAGYTFGGAMVSSSKMVNTTGRISMLGVELRDDHPISIEYPYFSTETGGAYKDPKFFYAQKTTSGAVVVKKDNVAAGARAADDEIKLYTDGGGSANWDTRGNADVAKVQCASCHNPHGTYDSGINDLYPAFLRVTTTNSLICVTCHIK